MIPALERVRTKKKALGRLVEIMGRVHVIIDHGDALEEAEWLKAQVSSKFNCVEIWITDWAPVAGVHNGPGVIGLSFYAED